MVIIKEELEIIDADDDSQSYYDVHDIDDESFIDNEDTVPFQDETFAYNHTMGTISKYQKLPGTPMETIEAAGEASADILPEKSKARYQQAYDNFQKWKISNSTISNSQRVIMAYFTGLAEKYSPSTLWSTYSMLKATLNISEGVDISKYTQLIAMLKKMATGYVTKKVFIFEATEIQKFIDNAPDVLWLDVKV